MKVKLASTRVLMFVVFLVISCSTVHALSAEEEHTYEIILDDFKDGNVEAWDMYIPPDASYGTSWSVLDDEGNRFLSIKGTMIASTGDINWNNYTLTVRVKLNDVSDEARICVRMGDEYKYFVGIHPQDLEFVKMYKRLSTLAKVELANDNSSWRVFRIVCVASMFRVYVDEELKMECVDDDAPILYGRIGFECGPRSIAYFDDVRVTVTHLEYVEILIEKAERAIEEARMAEADIDEAESMLEDAEVKLADGNLAFAESLARDAAAKAIGSIEEKISTIQEPPPEDQQSTTTQLGSALTIEKVATLITIGGAAAGSVGWVFRTRGVRKKRTILYNELIQILDDTYDHFRIDARRCEAELHRFKERVINEFKQGMITEENYSALDERIEKYIRNMRDENE